jgi:hypothetical protein
MANQIEHIPHVPATAMPTGAPLTLLRAEILATATLNARSAVALIRHRNTEINRTITWLEHSYLMRKVLGGWRLTATGERALAETFYAVVSGWKVCGQCKRTHPPGAFLGKKGKPVKYCAECRSRALMDRGRD